MKTFRTDLPARLTWPARAWLVLIKGPKSTPQFLWRVYPGERFPLKWTGRRNWAMQFPIESQDQLKAYAEERGFRVESERPSGIRELRHAGSYADV